MNQRTLLTVSLLLNILLLGFVAGANVERWNRPKPSIEGWMTEAGLPSDRQAPVIERMKTLRESSGNSRGASNKAREALIKVLEAEKFDPLAYQKHAEYMLELRQRSRAQMTFGMGELAKELDQPQRKALAHIVRRYNEERDKCTGSQLVK